MPKVSDEYRAARREQILEAAKRCFLREGFHETSMQDVFAESGLSAGAVYRYFTSKDEMILAIAERNVHEVAELIHALVSEPHAEGPGALLGAVLDVVHRLHRRNDLGAVAVLVWSEALRNPALSATLSASVATIRDDFAAVVAKTCETASPTQDTRLRAIIGLLMTVVPGYIMQLALFGPTAVAGIPDAARATWPT